MKVSELTTLDPTTPWLEYINTILTTDIVQVLSIKTFSSCTLLNITSKYKIKIVFMHDEIALLINTCVLLSFLQLCFVLISELEFVEIF